jgi:hypothetical protein
VFNDLLEKLTVAVMNRLKSFIKNNRGDTNILIPVMFIIGIMFFVVLLIFITLMVRYNQGKDAIVDSLKSCETINYQYLYSDLIEASSYDTNTDYNTSTYTQGFYTSLSQYYPHINQTTNDDGTVNYDICDSNGNMLFQITDVSLTISPENVSMPDGVNTRLVYHVTGNIITHYSAFSSDHSVSFQINKTATYQYISQF